MSEDLNVDARVDLNADLGESFGRWQLGDDAAMLELITSANVAAGFHAGDPRTLRTTCAQAVQHGVIIGAQVGYRDLAGFGRRFIDVDPADLTADILYQVGALDALATSVGGRVRYLKPHGALYNAIVDHRGQAQAVVDALLALPHPLPLLGLPGSLVLELAADHGIRTVTEYFIDRNYTDDGRLVDRRRPDALITDPELAAERAVAAARERRAESFCTHGDSPGAVRMARTVRDALTAAGVAVEPFITP
ncbi:LamB/YcsF family protein [Microlunatus elymi]|uniref:LamB/YcsF family protein n=1 Tax=Microlunatus elymi TaxID=2596828 RepID=A0A516PX03_9ACTN|nr:5-oxoprolinase subunit PxpA [Microlunatus elymi]QDP95690.1 LamB/YcsF family protein [Microlunatus elymi]